MQEVQDIKQAISVTRARMEKTVEDFRRELGHLRTGQASVTLLEDVKVDYYGVATPVNQLAKLATPEPTLIVVQPFDPSITPAVEKAIQSAELGLNPSSDGKVIRVPIPPLTEERRKGLVKVVKKSAEDRRVSIRNARRDGNELLKQLEKEKEISKDDARRGQERIQKLTDQFIKELDEIAAQKEKEVMEE